MKRKKQRRLLLVLLVLLLAVCVGYFFLLRYNAEQETAETDAEETSIAIYPEDFDSSSISSIRYHYDGESLSFSLQKDGETWQYDDNTKFPLNQSSLTGMNTQLTSLTASRKIKDNLDNAADYGLDQPSNEVTVKDSDGTEFTIYFGNTNESASVTYIYTSAGKEIYTIDSGVKDYFSHPLLDMIVEDELPEPDSTAVFQKLAIKQGEDSLTLSFNDKGNPNLDYLGRCSWFANLNGEKFAADDDAVSSLTSTLSSLTTSGCAAFDITEKELATYGLDQPSAVITMKYTQTETVESEDETGEASETEAQESAEKAETESEEAESEAEEETSAETVEVPYSFTLKIGKAVGDYHYVTWDNISQVYLMSTSTLESLLNVTRADLTYMKPFNFSVSSINEMEIKYQDLTFDYKISTTTKEVETTDEDGKTKTEEQEVTTYTLNGEEIESTDLTGVLASIQTAAAEKLYPTEEGNAPIGDEAITVTVQMNRAKRSQVELVLTPYDNNYYALYVDGTPSYLMNKNDVASFINALPIDG